jgi:uncharacterized Zn finger protein (UPF0148 family)
MSHAVFISHSVKQEDQKAADAVYDFLEGIGIKCFMDKRDLVPGGQFPEQLARAIRDSQVVVLVLSSNSDASNAVQNEMAITSRNKIPLIPFRIENAHPNKLEFFLAACQWLDGFPPPLGQHLPNLASAVKHHLGIKSGTPRSVSKTKAVNRRGPETMICSRCGISPGERSNCTNIFLGHDFRTYTGQVYCSQCGGRPGQNIPCTGAFTNHDFRGYAGTVFCARCGVAAGQRTVCANIVLGHEFRVYMGNVCCSQCGVSPGENTRCTGLFTDHDFRVYTGNVYCSRCGAAGGVIPSQRTSCIGVYVQHEFRGYTGRVFCTQCGAIPGVASLYTDFNVYHSFTSG